jgi:hypothetical protein
VKRPPSRRRHRYRPTERRPRALLPPIETDAPEDTHVLAERLMAIERALAPYTGPWHLDIDDPVYDGAGRIIDGVWTGKVYTGAGAWWPGEGPNDIPRMQALAELRNLLTHVNQLLRPYRKLRNR